MKDQWPAPPHRHFSIDTPPLFCEVCGKEWSRVVDGRKGRKERRERQRRVATR